MKVLCKEAGRLEECRVAERLCETATPIRGFGLSGARRCKGHLFMIEACDYSSEFMREIGMKPFDSED